MSERVEIDATDKAILNLLQEDGRMPMREIARQIGVAEGTIRQRLRKLQASDALRFNLVVDPFEIGFVASAYIRVRCDAGAAPSLAAGLATLDEVVFSGLTAGEWNLVAFVVVETRERINSLVETHIRSVPGVRYVDIREPLDIAAHRFDIARFIE